MSNFDRAVEALNDADVLYGALVSNEDYATEIGRASCRERV